MGDILYTLYYTWQYHIGRQLHGSGQPMWVTGRVKVGPGLGSLYATQTKALPHSGVWWVFTEPVPGMMFRLEV
jgi:hypothetical protein